MTDDTGGRHLTAHVGDSGSKGWDTTRADVVRQLRACLTERRAAATAVVTAVEGSAYRRPGARLVVTEGSSLGAITAGCLEGPVAEAARAAIEEGEPSTKTYDLTEDEDNIWGLGLGCNGVIDVLFDPVDGSLQPALDAMKRKDPAVVLTVLAVEGETELSAGDRTTVFADGTTAAPECLEGTDREPLPNEVVEAITAELESDSLSSLQNSSTVSVTLDDAIVSVFCDVYEPLPTLLVFGSQGDVRPVTRFARETGIRVEIVTGRSGKATPEQFPAADVVRSVRPADVASAVDAPEHTYAVVMSHNFIDDQHALRSLLRTDVPYIGLMGPRKRFDEMREAIAEDGGELSRSELERISTPVGLDLAGDEPTQIAMSIVGEVLAAANDAGGGPLSERDGPIHGR